MTEVKGAVGEKDSAGIVSSLFIHQKGTEIDLMEESILFVLPPRTVNKAISSGSNWLK